MHAEIEQDFEETIDKRSLVASLKCAGCTDGCPDNAGVRMTQSARLVPNSVLMSLLEKSDSCVKLLGLSGSLDFMNCGGQAAMDIDDFDLVRGLLWWDLWPSETHGTLKRAFQTAVNGCKASFTARCPTAKGTDKIWEVHLGPMLTSNGGIVGVICTSRELRQIN